MKTDIEKLEELKKLAMKLVSSKKKFIKLSDKRLIMRQQGSTQKSIETAECNLNWHAMEYDKLFRETHAASVDCGLSIAKDDYSEIEYNPSQFHRYNYKPRIPLCRQKA